MAAVTGPAAAQDVAFTQYYLNLAGVNPGFTGAEDYLDLKVAFRQGWNDFGVKNDNLFISAYGTLGSSRRLSVKRNALRISNVTAYESARNDNKIRRRHGLGAMMTSRNVGPYAASVASLNYAYHLPISPTLMLSLGTKIGYGSQRIDFSGYTVRDQVNDAFYQQLIHSNQGNQNTLLLDFGSVLYSNRFYVAISSGNLVTKNVNGNGLLNVGNKRQYMLQGGYNAKIGEEWVLNTGLKFTEAYDASLNWSLNSRVRYKQLIYVGAAYDHVSKISLLFGLSANGNFTLNYSYDHYLSNPGSLNVSVHELILGIAMFNKFGSMPRFW